MKYTFRKFALALEILGFVILANVAIGAAYTGFVFAGVFVGAIAIGALVPTCLMARSSKRSEVSTPAPKPAPVASVSTVLTVPGWAGAIDLRHLS